MEFMKDFEKKVLNWRIQGERAIKQNVRVAALDCYDKILKAQEAVKGVTGVGSIRGGAKRGADDESQQKRIELCKAQAAILGKKLKAKGWI